METTKEIATVAEPRNLSAQFTEKAITTFKEQRANLLGFIQSQLKEGINNDFAKIPGTPKKTLLKPGAEKLASLFQLGSRILDSKQEIDRENGFAIYTTKVQVYHIPTGYALAESEASANSEEKKFRGRPFADLLNTLGKMSFKRAFVSAVVLATNASDFFSVDLDDTDTKTIGQEKAEKIQAELEKEMPEPKTPGGAPSCDACGAGLMRTKKADAWFCPNWKETGTGTHSYLKD